MLTDVTKWEDARAGLKWWHAYFDWLRHQGKAMEEREERME